ncbi:MAG TPA: hypothetical protein G4O08_08300 [Anaerolineae bacterium]|nr:hypothetical protein [Anaerolineae bacterium]
MITDLPEQAYGLGTPSSEFRMDRSRLLLDAASWLVIFAFFGLLHYWVGVGLIPLIFGAIPLGVSVAKFIKLFRNYDLRVIVFPENLSFTCSGRTMSFRWDDVSIIWEHIEIQRINFIPTRSIHQYTIETNQGEKIIFDRTLKGIDALGLILKKKVGEHLIPKVVKSLKSGQTVQFGDLGLNNQVIKYKDKSLAWNELKEIRIWEGHISIHSMRKSLFPFASLNYAVIPNAFIFIQLMKRFVNTG